MVVSLALIVSCAGAEPDVPCAPFTEIPAQLVSGTIAFTLDDRPPQTRALLPGDPTVMPAQDSGWCAASGFSNYVSAELNPLVRENPWSNSGGPFYVGCDLGGDVTLHAGFPSFDPRGWPIGVPEGSGARRAGFGVAKDRGNSHCSAGLSSELRVSVIKAVGGPAPYPSGVTADYVREFEVHLNALGLTAKDGDCPVGISFSADLHFLQTASDAKNNARPTCSLH